MCLEIYELYSTCFLTAPGLARETVLKKTKVKLDLLTDIDMLLMVEGGIKGGIYHAFHRYTKANNKYMKEEDKKKKRIIKSWMLRCKNLYDWAMSQKWL